MCECQRKGFCLNLGVMPLPLNVPWRIFGQCVGGGGLTSKQQLKVCRTTTSVDPQLLHLLDRPLDESRCEDLLAATIGIVVLALLVPVGAQDIESSARHLPVRMLTLAVAHLTGDLLP